MTASLSGRQIISKWSFHQSVSLFLSLMVLSSLLITMIYFWCKNNTVSISKAANQQPIRTMAPPHTTIKQTICGKLGQQLITLVSSFTKLENLTAMSVLNFAHPPHEKKGETHEGQKLKIKRLLVHFRVKGLSLNIGLASPEEWKDRDCHPLHVWWSLFTQMDGIGLLI